MSAPAGAILSCSYQPSQIHLSLTLVDEAEQRGRFCFAIHVWRNGLCGMPPPRELDGRHDEGWVRPPNTVTTFSELTASGLKELIMAE